MRILLVDDDDGVVVALTAVLKTLSGHEVRSAGTGDAALAAAAEMGGVDLLITDVVMEPMDGFTLRDQMVALYPSIRTILISGFDLTDYPEQTQNHQLLGKPVEADALRAAVNKELPAAPEPVPEPAPLASVPVEEAPTPTPAPVPEPVIAEEIVPPSAPVAPEPVKAPLAEDPAPAPAPVLPPPVATPVAVPVVARPTAVPVAKPVAVPVAKPVAVPVAKPVAVPVATPVAKPAGVPVAVPVAKAGAVPVARPAVAANAAPIPTTGPAVKATPTVRAAAVPAPTSPQPTLRPQAVPAASAPAVPIATPTAVPVNPPAATVRATAVPRPSAVGPTPPAAAPTAPTAQPSATAPAQPTVRMSATVRAQPVPPPTGPGARPTAVPVARPGAAPAAKPTAVPAPSAVQTRAVAPVAAPSAVAPSPTTIVATPVSAPSFPPPSFPGALGTKSGEDLSGRMLGAYQLNRKTGEGRWGGIYAGVQTSINRAVSIEVLDAAKAADATSQARFVADARAKAAVQHPSILAVYEAGEAEGRFFYAYEYVDGQTIAELKAAGQRLDEPTALKVLRVAADGLSYFNVHHTPHTPPDAGSISLGADGHPRLANLATQLADETLTPPQEIQALGRVMLGVLPAIQSLSQGLREMLKRMVQPGAQALTSWGQLLQGIKALEPKIVPTDAAKISAQDRAAIAAVEQARKQQKRSLYYNLGSVVTLILLVGVTVWYFLRNKQRIYDEQIQVPAGEFLFANGVKKTLPDFWIDKYEVTYGQYAEFVKALEGHPTTEFDHKDQPRLKNTDMHKPLHWAIFYGNAREGRAAHSTPIDLSCPVMEVDFWDAYAYAKWKGRELPTEEEWEKAARGTKGFLYPWGDDVDLKKVNSNADFNGNDPGAKGQVDGFNFWNPVDKVLGDKSPFGIIGMAGNVREWTGTWDPVKKRPIVKGGSFMSSDVRLDQRMDLDPSAISEALGFRTITRTPPNK